MQVPVGIILKGEQKNEDMVEILEDLQKYVPTVSTTESVDVPGESTPMQVHVDKFHHLEIGKLSTFRMEEQARGTCKFPAFDAHYTFSGGDQMTASRTRSSQRIRSNSLRGKDRLEGMVPVVEDWHSKVCLLGVSILLPRLMIADDECSCIFFGTYVYAGHLETTV